jgi:ATP-dependent helicase/nuclease subunit B
MRSQDEDSKKLKPLLDISQFECAIKAGDLILTPNNRLAAAIQHSWGESQAQAAWERPRILALDHWIRQSWDALQDASYAPITGKAILPDHLLNQIWQRAIAFSGEAWQKKHSTIALETQTLLESWGLSLDDADLTPPMKTFVGWQRNVQKILDQQNGISFKQAARHILNAYASGSIKREKKIHLYGFQTIQPLTERLLKSAANDVSTLNLKSINTSALVCKTSDVDSELAAAAQWVVAKSKENPSARVGLICPSLDTDLTKITRIVGEAKRKFGINPVVNMSAGTPLSDTQVGNSSLLILDSLRYANTLEHWLNLLHSKHSNFDTLSIQQKVDIEINLRELRKFDINRTEFVSIVVGVLKTSDAEKVLKFIDFDATKSLSKTRQSFTQWAEDFSRILSIAGFTGPGQLSSLEYQQCEIWQLMMEELKGFDAIDQTASFSYALSIIRQLSGNTVFHAQTNDAPIQVLGMLEGAGLQFDYLWVVGLHERAYPQRLKLNAVLSAGFQRKHKMPFADPIRELEIAKNVVDCLQNNSGEIVFSYAAKVDDQDLAITPILSKLPCFESSPDKPTPWLDVEPAFEIVEDNAPNFNQKKEHISTGSTLLKNQATCPFNAFAIHRLKAEKLETPLVGMRATERGSMLHDVLQEIWKELKNSETLHSKTDMDLTVIISAAISRILDQWSLRHPSLKGIVFRRLEQQRLEKLMAEWIEVEKQREPFEVKALEVKKTLKLAGIKFSMRLDRVDNVGGGDIVIDYKSGKVTPHGWKGPRPKDPQMPLYVIQDPNVIGAALAQIRGGDIKLDAITKHDVFQGSNGLPSWDEFVDEWKVSLTDLAQEFSDGVTSLEVFNKTDFQFQKHLLPLNRYNEINEINKINGEDK